MKIKKLNNKEFRKQLRTDAKLAISSIVGTELSSELSDIEYKVVTSTKNTYYFAIPLNNENRIVDLSKINAAGIGSISLYDFFTQQVPDFFNGDVHYFFNETLPKWFGKGTNF